MSEVEGYTPSTTEVRGAFAIANFYSPQDEAHANFDRWLLAERARIWDYCCEAIDNHELNTQQAREGNPFRKGGDA